ncbi:PREDICTED: F-box protein At3g08750-like [Brassica oleracea var. oleracea]|uniref:F-box domain-containing protein n=1 Tax=Brassica oleracea var. oleracea TaxID=109376 RepID=A0A0D3BAK4_BRAOL|nr:PREDICTED: F-box protein At3g08750-like [Brassica oleracea var. oleracea]
MASPRRSWSLPLLPLEIIQEIFYRTPAEALVRSKPTCKKWHALITNKSFINKHLQRSKERPQERFIRIFDKVRIMDPITRTSAASPIPNELLQHQYNINTLIYTLMVHCDGLMLVAYRGWKCRSDGSILPNIALWNPLLNKIKWVEQAAGCITSSDYYGIGYNGDGNYKLVRFTCRPFEVEGFEDVPEVEIYEFETSSWRTVGGKVDVDVEITRKCVSVMGNMYWVAYRCWKEDEKFIRVFDFSDETFKDICFCPPSYGDNSHLSCFNGDSLSLLLQQDEASRKIEVWVSSKLGDGDVTFSKYFSLSGPDLPALRVQAKAARPVYCFVKPKSVIVWCVEVEGEGTDEACSCCTLYEIDEDGVKSKKVTERNYARDYSRAFVCGYAYVPSTLYFLFAKLSFCSLFVDLLPCIS